MQQKRPLLFFTAHNNSLTIQASQTKPSYKSYLFYIWSDFSLKTNFYFDNTRHIISYMFGLVTNSNYHKSPQITNVT